MTFNTLPRAAILAAIVAVGVSSAALAQSADPTMPVRQLHRRPNRPTPTRWAIKARRDSQLSPE